MPRVRVKATEYKRADLPKFIKKKLIDSNKKQSDIAQLLGITPASLTNRMQKGLFSYSDLVEIFSMVGATDEEIIALMRKENFK